MSQESNESFNLDDSDNDDNDDAGSDFEASEQESSDEEPLDVGSEEDSDAFEEEPKKKQKQPAAKKKPQAKKAAPAKKVAAAKKPAAATKKPAPSSASKKAAPVASAKKTIPAVSKTPAPLNKKRPCMTNEKGPVAKKAMTSTAKPRMMAGASSATTKPAPVAQITGAQASARILEYCRKANRPYSVINITDNLRKEISKPNVQKIVDDLSNKGKLSRKEFGKTKVYWYNQDLLSDLECTQENLAAMDVQYKTLAVELQRVAESESKKRQALQILRSEPADADLEKELSSLQAEVEAMRKKAALLEGASGPVISASDREKMTKRYNKCRKAWVERKRMCMDKVDDLADNMEKKKKDVIEMLCVETDEEARVVLPAKEGGNNRNNFRRR
jgi:hypothetical protein